jgi:integrase
MVACPECGSTRIVKNGLRVLSDGSETQLLRCRDCGRNFLENYIRFFKERGERQLCTILKEAKKLDPATEIKTVVEEENKQQEIKGKIIELCFYMQKQDYAKSTIQLNNTALNVLIKRGADLANPESVKEILSNSKVWSENRKRNIINAYSLLLKIQGIKWEKPKVKMSRGFPFIPKKEELDNLIAGCGKKLSAFLQLLEETAMRCGEAKRLMWINIDLENNIITLNAPEKGLKPRMWKVSPKLLAMLNCLPRVSEKVFGDGPITSMKTTFIKSRKRLAFKLQNPRMLKISFHKFRHWKATMLYHKTKDPYYVKNFLGHKSLKSTEICINIEHSLFEAGPDDAFTARVAEKPEEVKTLLEAGFECVCQKDNLIFLRKRK